MDEVRKNLSLDLFHEVDHDDLVKELKRLEEKHERYLKCVNENTVRTQMRMAQIKEYIDAHFTAKAVA